MGKVHPCNICGNVFSSVAYVKEHKRIHTGEKSFVCGIDRCEKTFRNQSHVGDKRFQCDTCDHKCLGSAQLSRHKISAHWREATRMFPSSM